MTDLMSENEIIDTIMPMIETIARSTDKPHDMLRLAARVGSAMVHTVAHNGNLPTVDVFAKFKEFVVDDMKQPLIARPRILNQ